MYSFLTPFMAGTEVVMAKTVQFGCFVPGWKGPERRRYYLSLRC